MLTTKERFCKVVETIDFPQKSIPCEHKLRARFDADEMGRWKCGVYK